MNHTLETLRVRTRNGLATLRFITESFSRRERAVFFFFSALVVGGVTLLLLFVNEQFLVSIPARGGSLTEGIVGTPRFVNPVLAISDADRDLTALTFAGLTRVSSDGTIVPDLAESFILSLDGRTYTFTLRDDIYFHDGEKITAKDAAFTIAKVQDNVIKSPRRASWDGVSVEMSTDNPLEIRFILKQPYAPFLENTTLGIIPEHIWNNASSEQFGFSEFNTNPVGSGPYRVTSIKRNTSGIPEYYDLVPFRKFFGVGPYISDIRIKFYTNEEGLVKANSSGDIESMGAITPLTAKILEGQGVRVERVPLPRVFAVFFNQNQSPIFTDKAVRAALDKAVDKEALVRDVLHGYGTALNGPLPPGSVGYKEVNVPVLEKTTRMEQARDILVGGGWIFNKDASVWEKKKNKKETIALSFSLSTSDVVELKETADILKRTWEELGARVEIKVFDANTLNQTVIRPRKYDALLFGEIVGREADLFAFWHSSQRNDPGLNIALYTSSVADKLLEEARGGVDEKARTVKYQKFEGEIARDIPAVFLYSPDFLYILPKKVRGFVSRSMTTPSDRFSGTRNWFIETDRVWTVFSKKTKN